MNIFWSHFILFNLKFFGKIVAPNFKNNFSSRPENRYQARTNNIIIGTIGRNDSYIIEFSINRTLPTYLGEIINIGLQQKLQI